MSATFVPTSGTWRPRFELGLRGWGGISGLPCHANNWPETDRGQPATSRQSLRAPGMSLSDTCLAPLSRSRREVYIIMVCQWPQRWHHGITTRHMQLTNRQMPKRCKYFTLAQSTWFIIGLHWKRTLQFYSFREPSTRQSRQNQISKYI